MFITPSESHSPRYRCSPVHIAFVIFIILVAPSFFSTFRLSSHFRFSSFVRVPVLIHSFSVNLYAVISSKILYHCPHISSKYSMIIQAHREGWGFSTSELLSSYITPSLYAIANNHLIFSSIIVNMEQHGEGGFQSSH